MLKTWGIGYEQSKVKAKQIYSKIGRVPSPALSGDYVVFNSTGFTHLMRKGRIPRTRNEQKRRFCLLEYVEQIVKNPKAVIEYKQKEIKYFINRHGEKMLTTSVANFWTFIEEIKGCKIKVVIQQLNNGQKIFLSVMGGDVEIDNKNSIKKPHIQ